MSEVKNIPRLRFPEFNDKWEIDSIDGRIDFLSGTPIKGDEILDEKIGTPILRGVNIGEGVIRHSVDIDKYYNGSLDKLNKFLLKSGDLVIGMDGSKVGRNSSLINDDDEGLILIQRVARLRENSTGNSVNFIFQIVNSFKFHQYVDRVKTSSGIPHISSKQINNFKIGFPSIKEQQKIADFLTAVDKRIELLEKKKTLLETYKKGVMKKIFNQEIRFKDDNGNDFPDWEEKKVKEVFRITRGNVLSVNQMTETENYEFIYPVYSSQTKNKGVVGYYNEFLFQNSLTWTTDGANAGEVNFRKGKFYCTNVCGVLISDVGYANECIANLINSVSKRYVSYVGNPKLMNGVMAEIKLSFPSIIEQMKISKFLVSLDNQIELLETQIDVSKTWKKGILQKMFI